MNREQLKNKIRTILLENCMFDNKVTGKLIKKHLGFSGYVHETILEGTISDANEYCRSHKFEFTSQSKQDSHFGGYYINDNAIYEFKPDADFYGELMEVSASAQESLQRITLGKKKILSEIDSTKLNNIKEFLQKDKNLNENYITPIRENFKSKIKTELIDPTQLKRFSKVILEKICSDCGMDECNCDEANEAISFISNFIIQEENEINISSIKNPILKNYDRFFGTTMFK